MNPLPICVALIAAGGLVVYAAARILGWAAQMIDDVMIEVAA